MSAKAMDIAVSNITQAVAAAAGTDPADEFVNAWRQIEYNLTASEIAMGELPTLSWLRVCLARLQTSIQRFVRITIADRRCDGLRESLQRVNDLLREEEQQGLGLRSPQRLKQGEDAPKCLEHLIRDGGKLRRLCGECKHQPPEVRLVVMQALSEMFSNVRHPHFWGSQAVQIPLAAFLQGCMDKETVGDGQEDLVQLLGSVCDKLRSCEAELLPFFFNESAVGGEEEPFLVFTIILQYMDDARARVHEAVRRSVLACVQLQDPAVADFIATTNFASKLSAQAARHFNGVLENGGGDTSLFRALGQCNHVASSCKSQALCSKISDALRIDFVQTMLDGVRSQDPERCVNATCLVRAVVVSLRQQEAWEDDWRRAEDDVHSLGDVEVIHREVHAAIMEPIVSALVSPALSAELAARIGGAEEELALESVKLVASLLELCEEGVYVGLVLGTVPPGTMASDDQEFVASLNLHPCLLQSGDSMQQLDEEAYWTRRVWHSKGVARAPVLPAGCSHADSPSACVRALLNVLSQFHTNAMATNFAVTAALHLIASYPHEQLQRYVFDVSGDDSVTTRLGSVVSALSDELTAFVGSKSLEAGELEEQLRSFERSLGNGSESDTAVPTTELEDALGADIFLLRVLVLRSFVAQLAATLRASLR